MKIPIIELKNSAEKAAFVAYVKEFSQNNGFKIEVRSCRANQKDSYSIFKEHGKFFICVRLDEIPKDGDVHSFSQIEEFCQKIKQIIQNHTTLGELEIGDVFMFAEGGHEYVKMGENYFSNTEQIAKKFNRHCVGRTTGETKVILLDKKVCFKYV